MKSLIHHKKKKLFNIIKKNTNNKLVVHTDQIDVVPFPNKQFTFLIFDFAGTEIYYDTVDLLTTNRTFYLISFNMSTHHHDHQLQYWIDLVKDKVNCPIVIVGTHMENISKVEYNKIQDEIKNSFPKYPFFGVNNKNYKGVKELSRYLKSVALKSIVNVEKIPNPFNCIKEYISNLKLNGTKFMSKPSFNELIEPTSLSEIDCLNYLQDSGTIVVTPNFDSVTPNYLIILDPSFIIDCWRLLVNSKSIKQESNITKSDLFNICWSSIPSIHHNNILFTLLSFRKLEQINNNDSQLYSLSSTVKRTTNGHV